MKGKERKGRREGGKGGGATRTGDVVETPLTDTRISPGFSPALCASPPGITLVIVLEYG